MPKSNSNYITDKSFKSLRPFTPFTQQTPITSYSRPINFINSQDSLSTLTTSIYALSSAVMESPYDLTLSLPDLLVPRLKSNGLPAEPLTAFTLFFMDYAAKIKKQSRKSTIKEILNYANKEWNLQPPHVVEFFEFLSMTANEIYNSVYPERKYRQMSKIKINDNKINHNNSIHRNINNNKLNNSIRNNNNSINIPINGIPPTNVDSIFPNFNVDFELYDEPKEEEIYFSLFPTS